MDYKYIEQLLERYWNCETSVEEERILRAFYSQENVPAHLERYRDLFAYQADAAEETHLGEDFDRRVCRMAGKVRPMTVKAQRLTPGRRLLPLYHAAASVAVILLLGLAAHRAFNRPQDNAGWDYNAATYNDSYDNPQEAYETLDDGIRELRDVLLLSDGAGDTDSLKTPDTPQP